jgi:hypothetical protein
LYGNATDCDRDGSQALLPSVADGARLYSRGLIPH